MKLTFDRTFGSKHVIDELIKDVFFRSHWVYKEWHDEFNSSSHDGETNRRTNRKTDFTKDKHLIGAS